MFKLPVGNEVDDQFWTAERSSGGSEVVDCGIEEPVISGDAVSDFVKRWSCDGGLLPASSVGEPLARFSMDRFTTLLSLWVEWPRVS